MLHMTSCRSVNVDVNVVEFEMSADGSNAFSSNKADRRPSLKFPKIYLWQHRFQNKTVNVRIQIFAPLALTKNQTERNSTTLMKFPAPSVFLTCGMQTKALSTSIGMSPFVQNCLLPPIKK